MYKDSYELPPPPDSPVPPQELPVPRRSPSPTILAIPDSDAGATPAPESPPGTADTTVHEPEPMDFSILEGDEEECPMEEEIGMELHPSTSDVDILSNDDGMSEAVDTTSDTSSEVDSKKRSLSTSSDDSNPSKRLHGLHNINLKLEKANLPSISEEDIHDGINLNELSKAMDSFMIKHGKRNKNNKRK